MARLRGDEADLYERHHDRLIRQVAAYTRASEQLADEACSFAWAQLLRHQPERPSVAGWLWQVAVREVWRLERVEVMQQELRGHPPEACDPIGAAVAGRA